MTTCVWPAGCRKTARREFCDHHRAQVRRVRQHRGEYDRVDAAPAVAHLRVLRSRGWTASDLERHGGRRWCNLRALLDGDETQLQVRHARQILGIEPVWRDTMVSVSAVGSVRRIYAMMWQGHSHAAIAVAAARKETFIRNVCAHPTIAARNAAALAGACEVLGYTPGVTSRSRVWARRAGGVPLAAWPDDSIDDPDAVPDLSALRPATPATGRIDLDEVDERLGFGASLADIAAAMGFEEVSVVDALRRRERRRRDQQGQEKEAA